MLSGLSQILYLQTEEQSKLYQVSLTVFDGYLMRETSKGLRRTRSGSGSGDITI